MAEQFNNGYALLIAVNENQADGWALPDVAKDIAALEEVLAHPERCAYPQENVKTIMGQDAHSKGIMGGLKWLRERIQADTNATAVIYYTGHGIHGDAEPHEPYLVPYDFDDDMIELSALRATTFSQAVSALKPQRLLVVLDCCHAGGMGVKDRPAGHTRIAIAPSLLMEEGEASIGPETEGAKAFEELTQGKGRVVLSSSTGDQSSYIRQDGKMSIFTYHLIEAFTGHAQPEEGAKEVLVSDVMSHVWRHVPKSAKADWGTDQTPDYRVSGNFAIALLLGGKGLSKGQPAPDPLGELPHKETVSAARMIQMGDGSYVEGQVIGDVAGGDIDKRVINVGDISDATGIAIGQGAQACVTRDQGLGGDEVAALFAAIYQRIEARPKDPDVDQEELTETVQKIEKEAAKGEQANVKKVERWLGFLGGMAPDILKVTAATLANPVAGVAAAVRLIAKKAQAEAG
jgi:hypothetical protein